MSKCDKAEPKRERNEQSKKRGVEVSMWRGAKIPICGKPEGPIVIPKSGYVNEKISKATKKPDKKCHQECIHCLTPSVRLFFILSKIEEFIMKSVKSLSK